MGTGVAAVTGVLGGVGSATDVLPGGSWVRRHLGLTGEPGSVPPTAPGSVQLFTRYSAARRTPVECLVTRPAGFEHQPLPVCLALHPLGSSARGMVDLGLPRFLAAAVAQGSRPITVVAPDGAHYWHDDGAGDDPMRMLTDELPRWLGELGLAPPSLGLGLSMGGFGILSFGRRHPLRAIAALSPALFTTWSDAQALRAFPNQAEWEANDPIRHAGDLDGRRLGVWCGSADVFYDAACEFATRTHASVAAFDAGDHTAGYWYRVLPPALRYLSTHA